jgi:hypothetical protein
MYVLSFLTETIDGGWLAHATAALILGNTPCTVEWKLGVLKSRSGCFACLLAYLLTYLLTP